MLLGGSALAWLLFRIVLLVRSYTTAEFSRQWCCSRKRAKPQLPGRPFDFGVRGNLSKVFGRHPLLWLLPTNQGMEGNGIFFELSVDGDAVAAAQSQWSR